MTQNPSTAAVPPGHSVRFAHLDRVITAQAGDTLFQSARRNGVRIVGACGGRGTCGTCSVHVVDGQVEHSPHSASSGDAVATRAGRSKWQRACQLRALSDCTVEIAPRSLAAVVRADVAGNASGEPLPLDPLVRSVNLTLTPASLADPGSDVERLRRALPGCDLRLDLAALRQLPAVLRAGSWSLAARLRGDELVGVAATGSPTLGLGIDLGTTNVAAFLIDLKSGQRVASLAIENPQVAWGADVITRVNHAVTPGGGEELREAAITALNALAHDLCQAVDSAPEDIVDVVVCGNTAMQHLLLGLPVFQLGRAPFVAAVSQGMEVKARELGLAICPGAYVHIAPNVGGFVGGDHVTALLATQDLWAGDKTSLVMDIGTNTEISLIHKGQILSASCPSGPALEGGHISCGMRAAEGAIERVGLGSDGSLTIKVIGKKTPVGLCGSGVLDVMATMHRAGMVDGRGRLSAGHPLVTERGGKRLAQLAEGVSFSQDDVRAVQLAKAAVRAGVELLLRLAGLQAGDIEQFIIAGAFGAYIDVQSGIDTGLFPTLPIARFAQVGNAAGLGVQQMLASGRARRDAGELAARCRYVELSTQAGFQKTFLQHIGFNSSTKTTP
ncbi:MAG TPA: ASKHA domain-containing protein [Ramlibacter sp.]|nr:ASKHA domain-containing protein [Ramlibacter sp.]